MSALPTTATTTGPATQSFSGVLPSDTVLKDLASLQATVDQYVLCIPRPGVPPPQIPNTAPSAKTTAAGLAAAGHRFFIRRSGEEGMEPSVEQYAGTAIALNGLHGIRRRMDAPNSDDTSMHGMHRYPAAESYVRVHSPFPQESDQDVSDAEGTAGAVDVESDNGWEGFADLPSRSPAAIRIPDWRRSALLSLGQDLVGPAIHSHCAQLLGSLDSKLYMKVRNRSSPKHAARFSAAAAFLSDLDDREELEAEKELKLAVGSYILGRFARVTSHLGTATEDDVWDQSNALARAGNDSADQEQESDVNSAVHAQETAGTNLLRYLYANWSPVGARHLDAILQKELGETSNAEETASEMAAVLAEECELVRKRRFEMKDETEKMMAPIRF